MEKNHYLRRNSRWRWREDGLIDLCAPDGTAVRGLNDWETLVFNGADGSNTAAYIAGKLAQSHPSRSVDDYLGEIGRALASLNSGSAMILESDTKSELPEAYDQPLPRDGRQPE